jgi:hypothetical protein
MPEMLYVGLQDDDKIAVFALDEDSGKLTKRAEVAAAGRAVGHGNRSRPQEALRRLSHAPVNRKLPDRSRDRGPIAVGDGSAGGCADVSGARPHRPLHAVRITRAVTSRCTQSRRMVRLARLPLTSRNRGWGACDRDRSVQPFRFCASYRPHPGQCLGAAEKQSRSQRDRAVPQSSPGSKDWMIGCPLSWKMLPCVSMRRRIAAADVTAGQAQAQMHPIGADPQAVFAALGARHYITNCRQMRIDHFALSFPSTVTMTSMALAVGGDVELWTLDGILRQWVRSQRLPRDRPMVTERRRPPRPITSRPPNAALAAPPWADSDRSRRSTGGRPPTSGKHAGQFASPDGMDGIPTARSTEAPAL